MHAKDCELIGQILNDVAHHNIRIFRPPMYENEDEETQQENEEIIVSRSAPHLPLVLPYQCGSVKVKSS